MMASMERKYLLLAAAIASINQCCVGQPPGCPEMLQNIVVYEGTSVSFPNLFDGQTIQWLVLPYISDGSGLYMIADSDYMVQSPFEGTYSVNSSTLTIIRSSVAAQGYNPFPTAGLYLLNNMDFGCLSAAGLIVIQSGPVCSCDASDPNNKKLTCSANFAEYVNQQSILITTWKNNIGNTIQVDNTLPSLDALQSSVSHLSIAKDDGTIYECQLTFSAPENQPDFMASNAPNFAASCFTNCPLPSTTVSTTTTKPTTTTPAALDYSSQDLTNTVVYECSSASFPRMSNGQSVQWQVVPSSVASNEPEIITNYDDTVTPEFANSYAVSQSQLSIFNTTVGPQNPTPYSTAGLYILNYRNPDYQAAANLIVIRSGPTCAIVPGCSNVMMLTCSVVYAESHVQPCNPIFTWTNSNGEQLKQEQPYPLSVDGFVQTSVSQLSIASGDTSTYKCLLTFSAPASSPLAYVASAAPRYSASCFLSLV